MERWTAKPRPARIALFFALVGLAVSPVPAGATSPQGPNGRIAFTSGRDDGGTDLNNNTAQIWIIPGPGGTATRLTTVNGLQHRHPTWSPDRTKIAYAAGGPACPWDIFVRDLTQPLSDTNPKNITNSPQCEDRPTWSPDGTRIAYQRDGAGDNVDIHVQPADGSAPSMLVANPVETTANVDASTFWPRPTWSPDSQLIYYAKLIATNNHDIYRAPADGSNLVGNSVVTGNVDDTQPQVSPDGTKLCFTRQEGTKNVYTVPITGFGPTSLGTDGGDEYECAWSPDGSKVAFVRGPGDAGQILMRNSNATGNIDPVTDVAAAFDGNPDWTLNASPVCQNATVNAGSQASVSVQLACSDQGPAAEQTGVTTTIFSNPLNGALGALTQGDPSTVTYTPNANFAGADTIAFRGNDGTSDSPPATVTITVDRLAATIASAAVSPSRWRRGSLLPRFSRTRVGTTIRFSLSEAARVTLTFAKPAAGRRVRGRCVRPTRANRRRPRCTRYVTKGTLSFNGKAGLNRVRFQGRITRTRRLGLGRHRVTIGAVDAAGNRSRSRSAFFTIVGR